MAEGLPSASGAPLSVARQVAAWPLGKDVWVVATDPAGVAALAKPVGCRSHPNEPGVDAGALLLAPYLEKDSVYRWTRPDGEHKAWLLHRLDAPTSGVLLLATHAAMAERIRRAFASATVRKRYRAIVLGDARRIEPLWRDVLAERRPSEGRGLRVVAQSKRPAGPVGSGRVHRPEEGTTRVKCLGTTRVGSQTLSLLELEPMTGRTHQLRVQCQQRGLPIVGDATYGDFAANRVWAERWGTARLFLHALRVEVRLPATADSGPLTFAATCPLPTEFTTAIPDVP